MRFVARDLNCARIAPRDAGLGPRAKGDPSLPFDVMVDNGLVSDIDLV